MRPAAFKNISGSRPEHTRPGSTNTNPDTLKRQGKDNTLSEDSKNSTKIVRSQSSDRKEEEKPRRMKSAQGYIPFSIDGKLNSFLDDLHKRVKRVKKIDFSHRKLRLEVSVSSHSRKERERFREIDIDDFDLILAFKNKAKCSTDPSIFSIVMKVNQAKAEPLLLYCIYEAMLFNANTLMLYNPLVSPEGVILPEMLSELGLAQLNLSKLKFRGLLNNMRVLRANRFVNNCTLWIYKSMILIKYPKGGIVKFSTGEIYNIYFYETHENFALSTGPPPSVKFDTFNECILISSTCLDKLRLLYEYLRIAHHKLSKKESYNIHGIDRTIYNYIMTLLIFASPDDEDSIKFESIEDQNIDQIAKKLPTIIKDLKLVFNNSNYRSIEEARANFISDGQLRQNLSHLKLHADRSASKEDHETLEYDYSDSIAYIVANDRIDIIQGWLDCIPNNQQLLTLFFLLKNIPKISYFDYDYFLELMESIFGRIDFQMYLDDNPMELLQRFRYLASIACTKTLNKRLYMNSPDSDLIQSALQMKGNACLRIYREVSRQNFEDINYDESYKVEDISQLLLENDQHYVEENTSLSNPEDSYDILSNSNTSHTSDYQNDMETQFVPKKDKPTLILSIANKKIFCLLYPNETLGSIFRSLRNFSLAKLPHISLMSCHMDMPKSNKTEIVLMKQDKINNTIDMTVLNFDLANRTVRKDGVYLQIKRLFFAMKSTSKGTLCQRREIALLHQDGSFSYYTTDDTACSYRLSELIYLINC